VAADDVGTVRLAADQAAEEVAHLRSVLGDGVLASSVGSAVTENPMIGTGSMMATSDFSAAVQIDLQDMASDEDLLSALDGFTARHPGVDPARSTLLVGRHHALRDRTAAGASETPTLQVMVALRGPSGLSLQDFREGWLAAGQVNSRNHPTCVAYSQVHADVELTGRALDRSGLSFGPFTGLAVEVFLTADDLHAGHEWAKSPESLDGSPVEGEHLMHVLDRVIDFTSSAKLLAVSKDL
jgi:hypothetical protein